MILKMEKPTFWKKYYRNYNNLRVDWILYFKKLEWYTNNLLEFLFLLNFYSWVKLRRNRSIFGLQKRSSLKMAIHKDIDKWNLCKWADTEKAMLSQIYYLQCNILYINIWFCFSLSVNSKKHKFVYNKFL